MPPIAPRHKELSAEGLEEIGLHTVCDREPIHLSGAIQPHGYLLVLDPNTLTLQAASANLLARVGEAALGAPLSRVLGPDLPPSLRLAPAPASTPSEIMPDRQRLPALGRSEYFVVSHRRGPWWIMEIEEAPGEAALADNEYIAALFAAGRGLAEADSVEALCETAAREIRRISGFDRVMIYRFDPDAHGQVVAEAREETLEPFLGLHYPATDIPRQARLLYLRNWIRVIPDVRYQPSPLLGAPGFVAANQIDLSHAALRSVSAYHLQYLDNMGVRATMTASLICDNQLWGMISCHHHAPKRVEHLRRLGYEMFAQQLSARLRTAQAADFRQRTQDLGRLSAQVVAAMAAGENAAQGAASVGEALLGMAEAQGAVVGVEGRLAVVGAAPPVEALEPLIDYLALRAGAGPHPFVTEAIAAEPDLPPGLDLGEGAPTGAMYLPLQGREKSFLLWLRAERAANVRWAGRNEVVPDQTLEPLQPRASFAEWVEMVKGRSAPWRPEEIAVALELGQSMPEVLAHRAQNRLMRLALHDPLTGLPNRMQLMEKLEAALRAGLSGPGPHCVAVFYIDLDGFKAVNDTMSHAAGDALLREIGRRLSKLLRPGDTVARMGGDEFVVLAPGVGAHEANGIGRRIAEACRAPLTLEGRTASFVSASIGVAIAEDGAAAGEALSQADAAMYHAKRSGKDQVAIYDAGQRLSHDARRTEYVELRDAIAAGQIVPFFQPVFGFDPAGAPQLHGFEALARWRHPERGLIPPARFIALAEEYELIGDLGRSILRQSLRHLAAWPDPRLVLAVNVATSQLLSEGFAEGVLDDLRELGLSPERLNLEITESQMMQSPEKSLAALHHLGQAGVEVGIDDFGTGFSSLAYVRNLPAAVLKIDRTFVSGLPDSVKDRAVVKAVIELAHELGMRTVAEGVETPEQLECLRREGSDYVQGYFLGRPQAPEDISFSAA